MTPAEENGTTAAARAAAARTQLAGTLSDIQARLSPKALARDAVQELKETGQELARDGLAAAQRNPATVGGAAVAIVLFLVRRPLSKIFRSAGDATAATVTSLNHDRATRRARKSARKRTPK